MDPFDLDLGLIKPDDLVPYLYLPSPYRSHPLTVWTVWV